MTSTDGKEALSCFNCGDELRLSAVAYRIILSIPGEKAPSICANCAVDRSSYSNPEAE